MYNQKVKDLARELDPECWISYSGMEKNFKQQMDWRRRESLMLAEQKIEPQTAELYIEASWDCPVCGNKNTAKVSDCGEELECPECEVMVMVNCSE